MIPIEMLARWRRIEQSLEKQSEQMVAAGIHVDWSDISVLDAYLSDWDEKLYGPRPDLPLPLVRADWAKAPEWAMWWAVDPNGWAHWFQEEPILALTINYCGWVPKTINGVQIGAELWAAELDLDLGIDWRLLKEQRPIL